MLSRDACVDIVSQNAIWHFNGFIDCYLDDDDDACGDFEVEEDDDDNDELQLFIDIICFVFVFVFVFLLTKLYYNYKQWQCLLCHLNVENNFTLLTSLSP